MRTGAVRRRALTLGLLCAALVAGGVSPATSLERVTSAYPAGDFETVGLTPRGWVVTAPSPGRGVVSTSRAVSGSRSLLVEDPSTTGAVVVARPVTVQPGATYALQGYAYTKRGAQTLGVNFLDAAGRVVSRHATASTGAAMVWSRVSLRAVAPATARRAVVLVVSSPASVSTVWWDAIDLISPTVANASFEVAPTSAAPVPGWGRTASGGANAWVTTTQAFTGSRSLHLADSTAAGATAVRSWTVPVFPGVGHDLQGRVRLTSGSLTQTVRWYDAAHRLVRTQPLSVAARPGTWTPVAVRLTSPSNAHYASIELGTTVAGTGTADWDAVSLVPALGAPARRYAPSTVSRPLDGFANTNATAVAVIGGRPKLFSVVSGHPGELQVVDVQTGTLDVRRALPGTDVGWALTTGSDGSLYVGGTGGHLFRYLPASGTLRDLGRVTPRATTVWDVERAPDGRIWGVSYPGAELWVHSPSTGRTTSFGSVSPSHTYARSLALAGGYAWVGVGSTRPALVRVSMARPTSRTTVALPVAVTTGTVSDVEALGRYLLVRTPAGRTSSGAAYAGERRLYDTRTGSWRVTANLPGQTPSGLDGSGRFYYLSYKTLWAVSSTTGAKTAVCGTTLAAGRERHVLSTSLGGVAGPWVLAYDPAGYVRAVSVTRHTTRTYAVAFRPTKLRIKTLDAGPAGTLYLGGIGGPSLGIVDPTAGAGAQYPARSGVANAIGELEGAQAHGSVAYIGTYTGGKVFRYDTTRPWVDGSNPRLVASLGTTYRQDRPMAWATAGSRTFFGTVPAYGVRGGVLGFFGSDTSAAVIVPQPVAGQSVVSLAASGNVVYGGTSRWGGLGAAPSPASARIFAYDAATRRKLWESAPFPGAQSIGAVTIGPGGAVWAASGPSLVELHPRTGVVMRRIMVYPAPAVTGAVYRNADLVYADGLFYLAAMDRVYVVDPVTLRVTAAVPGGLSTPQIALVGDDVYYASGTTLMSVDR